MSMNLPFAYVAGSGGGAQPLDYSRPPGPGCSIINNNNTSSTSVSTPVGSGGTQSANAQNSYVCNPSFDSTQIVENSDLKKTVIDLSTTIVTKSAMKVMSELTNQMIVNSLTKTTNKNSQDVKVSQTMNIEIGNVKGSVVIEDVAQTMTIDMTNIATISMNAFDNIRTDLATDVMQSFKSALSQETISGMEANLQSSIENQLDQSSKQRAEASIKDVKESALPACDPNPIIATNQNANTTVTQIIGNKTTTDTKLTAPYNSNATVERELATKINNAVTQNFTKETVNILSQSIMADQSMSIKATNIGGNVTLKNIKQNMNIILRQTLSAKMDIGNAIVNDFKNSAGLSTDDATVIKNTANAKLTDISSLRNTGSQSLEAESSLKYERSITNGSLGSCNSSGSSGSSFFSWSSFCILCVCIACGPLSNMLSGVGNIGSGDGGGGEGDGGGGGGNQIGNLMNQAMDAASKFKK